jgi:hypothetical protein
MTMNAQCSSTNPVPQQTGTLSHAIALGSFLIAWLDNLARAPALEQQRTDGFDFRLWEDVCCQGRPEASASVSRRVATFSMIGTSLLRQLAQPCNYASREVAIRRRLRCRIQSCGRS